VVLVYFVTYATRQLGLSLPLTLGIVVVASAVCAPVIVLAARWSDVVGRQRMTRWGLGGLVLWSLAFFPLLDTRSAPLALLAVTGMLVIQGFYLGPQPAVFAELFPTALRYSGASLSLTLGTIIGGAIAPIVATYLFSLTRTSTLITVYMTAVSVVSFLCSLGLRETYRDNLARRADR
jgi:hypothetical protein